MRRDEPVIASIAEEIEQRTDDDHGHDHQAGYESAMAAPLRRPPLNRHEIAVDRRRRQIWRWQWWR